MRDPTALATAQLDIHYLWIFVRDLLRNLVSTSEHIHSSEHTVEHTDQNFEFLTHNTEFDSIDDSDLALDTIHIDDDLNADDHSQTQKLTKQKHLGNFKSIFRTIAKPNPHFMTTTNSNNKLKPN